MSFLGLKIAADEVPIALHYKKLPFFNFYFEHNTQQIITDDYTLYTIGNIQFIGDKSDIVVALEAAAGTFCYVLCRQDEVIVGTDKMGFYPLYYNVSQGFNFSNFIPHLKHRLHGLTINWDAWNEILNGGDILGSKTTINDIFRLREGERITLNADGVKLTSTEIYQPMPEQDVAQYLNDNNRLLLSAVEQLSDSASDIVMPLTGGHDSRRLAMSAGELKVKYSALTQETADKSGYDVDSYIAKEMPISCRLKRIGRLLKPTRRWSTLIASPKIIGVVLKARNTIGPSTWSIIWRQTA